jgi:hypothetical protein
MNLNEGDQRDLNACRLAFSVVRFDFGPQGLFGCWDLWIVRRISPGGADKVARSRPY